MNDQDDPALHDPNNPHDDYGHEVRPAAFLAPDLAVEVLSKSNTKKEMQRKLGEYFQAGVRERTRGGHGGAETGKGIAPAW